MGKFYGKIGFVKAEQTSPGVWEEIATEKECYGEVTRDVRRWNGVSDRLNDDITLDSEIRVLGTPFMFENFSYIRFIEWMGSPWAIKSMEIQYPRIVLWTGGVYNGIREQKTETSGDSD